MKIPILGNLVKGGMDVYKATKQTKEFEKGKCLLILKNYSAFLLEGIISPDLLYFTPVGINRKYRINGMYLLQPKNEKLFIILDENVETIDVKKKLKERIIKKPVYKFEIKDNKLVKTIDMDEYRIKGADELSAMSFILAKTSVLKHLEEPSKREILYIAILCLLAGTILGGIGALSFM